MFSFNTPKTVASIVAGLTKTLTELDELTKERETQAEAKEAQASVLIREAGDDRAEAHKARRIAHNLTELLS